MKRRLDRAGEKVLAEWLDHYKPSVETRRLIREAIDAYSEDENQNRFYSTEDFSNPGITVIAPRDNNLTVHVRIVSVDLFTLVRIIDGPGYLPGEAE